jgi:2-methylcitrate dehydratase
MMYEKIDEILDFSAGLSMDTSFNSIPRPAIEKMKMIILDSLACALGGLSSTSAKITRETFASEEDDASLWGLNRKGSEESAVLANGVSLRFLDFLEYFNVPTPKGIPQVFHVSEILPLIFALGEKQRISGKELLSTFYVASELSGKLCASVGSISLAERGFHHSTLAYLISPLVAGRLMNLNRNQMVNAASLGTLHSTLGIVDAEGEGYYMSKNFAFPFSSLTGLMYARMAKNGFTSSPRVMTGNKGFIRTILGGDDSFENFYKSPENGWIAFDSIKRYPVCGAAQSIAEASELIGQEVHLESEKIKKVTIRTNRRSAAHVGDPAKRYPHDKETADHSSPFIVALGLLKGGITPGDFTVSNYSDPDIKHIEDIVNIEHDKAFDSPEIYPAAEVTVEKWDGQKVTMQSIHPKGHYKNPVGLNDVKKKFRYLASGIMEEKDQEALARKILRLEDISDIRELNL